MKLSLDDLLRGAPTLPAPAPDAICVWRLSTQISAEEQARLSALLSADEKLRAKRFHFDRDRRRFTACRGCLRLLAGAYSGREPKAIRFRGGAQTKPELDFTAGGAPEANGLQFNISHSGELALLAFTAGREVGVDVEQKREGPDFAGIARRFFSPEECKAIVSLPVEARAELFYEYWSCKEACVKADGRGVSLGLDAFSVVASQRLERGPEGRPEWRGVVLHEPCGLNPDMQIGILDVGAGYAAAVAAPSTAWEVIFGVIGSAVGE